MNLSTAVRWHNGESRDYLKETDRSSLGVWSMIKIIWFFSILRRKSSVFIVIIKGSICMSETNNYNLISNQCKI